MTVFHLIRHADHALLGRALAGRTEIGLSALGAAQAAALAARYTGRPLDRVFTSPLRRTRETAERIAAACGAPIEEEAALLEVDFGDWTGLTYAALAERADWRAWNAVRSLGRAPAGETIAEVQTRACGFLHRVAAAAPDGEFAVVSHGDVIRAVLAWHLGIAIDLFLRLEISPASVSVLALEAGGPRVLVVNDTAGPDPLGGADLS